MSGRSHRPETRARRGTSETKGNRLGIIFDKKDIRNDQFRARRNLRRANATAERYENRVVPWLERWELNPYTTKRELRAMLKLDTFATWDNVITARGTGENKLSVRYAVQQAVGERRLRGNWRWLP